MINFKKVKSELNSRIAEILSLYGFCPSEKDGDLERKIDRFIDTFYFLFTDYGKRIFVEPWWGMRMTGIVDIYHEITEKDEEYFSSTNVLGNNLATLMAYMESGEERLNVVRKQYLIEKEKDIETTIMEVSVSVKKYLLPYFEMNHSIDRIDLLLNSNPRDLIVHSWVYPNRAMMGLIAAKLNNRPDYEKLKGIYDEELVDAEDQSKREYEKLKVLLSKL